MGVPIATREKLAVIHTRMLEKMSTIKTVIRTQPSYDDLQNFANTQFPLVAVVVGLPDVDEKMSDRVNSDVDVIMSELKVTNTVYIKENKDPDTHLSKVAQEVFKKLYSNRTYDNFAKKTILKFELEPEYWHPYLAFRIVSTITYHHIVGGI
jgi:hypothetical protein